MSDSESKNLPENKIKFFGKSYLLLASISLCALVSTFIVSNSQSTYEIKLSIFISIVFFYLLFCSASYVWQKRQGKKFPLINSTDSIIGDDVETKLLALEEAKQYFGASLKFNDMFRFVANRINEIVPFTACALFLADEEKSVLKIVCAVGENAQELTGIEINSKNGLAGKSFQTEKTLVDDLSLDKEIISHGALNNLNSAIAVPLLKNTDAFGVLMLYGSDKNNFTENARQLLEAVGVRVAPLFLASKAFENSLANALTDALTNLPNERAFYLVLENQIAEAQRFRDERALTILAIDIKNFGEVNQQFGHATGDGILGYAADTIKNQLRQMDFLARASSDEFLAVLPKASDEITREIVGRIEKAFVSKPFEVSGQQKIYLKLNFGAASFWQDGETAEHLLKHALLRKEQSKTTEDNKVLWFPKKYVN